MIFLLFQFEVYCILSKKIYLELFALKFFKQHLGWPKHCVIWAN